MRLKANAASLNGPKRKTLNSISELKGYTLVEVIVAVGIFAWMSAMIIGSLGIGFQMIESARDNTRAAQILQSEMENMRTLNWSEITALPSWESFTPSARFINIYKDRYQCYRGIWDNKYDSNGDSLQKVIYLRVQWEGQQGSYAYRSFMTYVTKEGLNDYYYRSY